MQSNSWNMHWFTCRLLVADLEISPSIFVPCCCQKQRLAAQKLLLHPTVTCLNLCANRLPKKLHPASPCLAERYFPAHNLCTQHWIAPLWESCLSQTLEFMPLFLLSCAFLFSLQLSLFSLSWNVCLLPFSPLLFITLHYHRNFQNLLGISTEIKGWDLISSYLEILS